MQLKTITNTSEFTSADIIEIIDDHFMNECNLLFVCDKQLAEFINNYVMDNYSVNNESDEYDDDNEESLEENIDQYYVSIYFSDDEDSSANFFVENAKGIKGEYKLNDIGNDVYVDYYICIDMDEEVVFNKLVGENATWNWLSVDLEDDNEYCDCNDCECDGCCEKCDVEEYEDDDEDEGIDYNELLDIFTKRIQDTGLCPDYIRNVLNDFANIFIPEEDECDKTEDCGECENKCQEYYDCEDENVETEAVCDDKCDTCEIPDEICEEINLINEVAEMIEDGDMCPVCLRNVLYDLYIKGKNIG